jgi:hypothetical protein
VVNGQFSADHYELLVSEFAIARQRDSREYHIDRYFQLHSLPSR